jgi:hypothetical protein
MERLRMGKYFKISKSIVLTIKVLPYPYYVYDEVKE